MGIRKINSRRSGCKPFFFFKGTREELLSTPRAAVTETFRKAGVDFWPKNKSVRKAVSILGKTGLKIRGRREKKLIKQLEDAITDFLPQGDLKKHAGRRWIFPIELSKEKIVAMHMEILKSGKITLHQQPITSGVRTSRFIGWSDRFANLQAILSEGFRGTQPANAVVFFERGNIAGAFPNRSEDIKYSITHEDYYAIEFMAPARGYYHIRNEKKSKKHAATAFIKRAKKEQVACINIKLAENITPELAEKKKQFYRKKIEDNFGVPVIFTTKKVHY